jgi:hypothetical protein
MVQRWDGTTWSIATAPAPVGATQSRLSGVRCATIAMCIAVGEATTLDGTLAYAIRWNGTSWVLQSLAVPSGATASVLRGVACPSTTSCFAVGDWVSGAGSRSLIERWNGTTWSVQSNPKPPSGSPSDLSAVACPSTTSCFAVGSYLGSGSIRTFVQRWNGTSWANQTSPNEASAFFNDLVGVACPSASLCFAVGLSRDVGGANALLIRWNGTSWTRLSLANPPQAIASVLRGVSCASTTSCFATGWYTTALSRYPMIKRYA